MRAFEIGVLLPLPQFHAFRTLRDGGFTRLEVMLSPGTMETLEALGNVLEAFDAR